MSSPKRHCMVVHAYYPLAETRVQRQAEALADAGYAVDVICLRRTLDEPLLEMVNGVQVVRLPMELNRGETGFGLQFLNYLHFFGRATLKINQRHRQAPYTAVQIHNLPDFLVFCAIIPKLQGVPILLDLHDLMPEFFAAKTSQGMQHPLTSLLILQERLACRFANQVITVTRLWRQNLITRGVPAEKVHVVMNVADDTIFQPQPAAKKSVDETEFHLFYHGTLVQRYGIDLILQAANQLRHQIPNLRVTIHGRGRFYSTLTYLTNILHLTDIVHFSHEYIPLTELPTLIQTADVAIVPYRRDVFTDGILPTKLMEYMALHVPVIAARTPVIEAYFDESMVEFFEPANGDDLKQAILKLYHHPKRRATLSENAKKFNQTYHWGKLKEEYIDLIANVTG